MDCPTRRKIPKRNRQANVQLTDFHVDPTCSPTHSVLMTGHYSSRGMYYIYVKRL